VLQHPQRMRHQTMQVALPWHQELQIVAVQHMGDWRTPSAGLCRRFWRIHTMHQDC
jgi:hypothetical protein